MVLKKRDILSSTVTESLTLPKSFPLSYNRAKPCKQSDRHLHFFKVYLIVSLRGKGITLESCCL